MLGQLSLQILRKQNDLEELSSVLQVHFFIEEVVTEDHEEVPDGLWLELDVLVKEGDIPEKMRYSRLDIL